jgi:hypothetical protein
MGMRYICAPLHGKQGKADAVMEGFSIQIQLWRQKKNFLLVIAREANDFYQNRERG